MGTHPEPMRGFLYIVEIIIVGLTLFLVVSLFANIPRIESDWTKTRLVLYGNDLFFSLDKRGINWLNETQVNGSMGMLLPRNLEFDLKVKNAIKPYISLGCVCSQDMLGVIEGFLNDFEINGVNTSFRIEWIDPSRISFPMTLDMILFLDRNIPGDKVVELENYLKHDRGVMEISGLDTNIVARTIHRDIFNLEWIDESIALWGDAGFQEQNPGKENYKIRKYFYHVPFRTGLTQDSPPEGVTSCTSEYVSGQFTIREKNYKLWLINDSERGCNLALYIDINGNNWLNDSGEGPFAEGETFGLDGYNFQAGQMAWDHVDMVFQESPEYLFSSKIGETVYPLDNSSEKIVLKRDLTYLDGRDVPVSVINYNMVDGMGRVAWLSNSSVSELKSDTKQLIKSLMVWVAGGEYWVKRGREKAEPVTFYFYKVLDQDMFQPIELILTLGYRQ